MSHEPVDAFIRRKSAEWERERGKPTVETRDHSGARGDHYWVREAWTWIPQHNLSTKALVLERIKLLDRTGHGEGAVAGDIEYRLSYWAVARSGPNEGKWIRIQFSPMIPARDFADLMDSALRDGTIL